MRMRVDVKQMGSCYSFTLLLLLKFPSWFTRTVRWTMIALYVAV
jgi:hypothetical protein